MVAGVRFIYEEDVRFDNVLIFQGTAGTGKTTILEQSSIKQEWYGQFKLRTLEDSPEKVYDILKLKLIADFGKLKTPKGDHAEAFKNLSSMRSFTFRRAYGHAPEEYVRRFLLAGTSNSPNLHNDVGVARRMWIIPIIRQVVEKQEFFDLLFDSYFIRQCWAQALYLYQNGYSWELTTTEEKDRVEIIENYREEDPWNEDLLSWAEEHDGVVVTRDFLGDKNIIRSMDEYQRHANKVSNLLSALYFERIRTGQYARKVY